MEIVVRGRHVDVSERFRSHVSEKLARIDRFGLPITHIDVEVSFEPNPRQAERAFEVELTCRGNKSVIRAEASAPDQYTAVDLAWGHLEERLRRASDKRRDHHKRVVVARAGELLEGAEPAAESAPATAAAAVEPVADAEPLSSEGEPVWEQGPIVVRLKEHTAVPMSVAQAVEAMELVGHDFYLFREAETATPAVVYRRRGYNYGLIRLDAGAAGGSDA